MKVPLKGLRGPLFCEKGDFRGPALHKKGSRDHWIYAEKVSGGIGSPFSFIQDIDNEAKARLKHFDKQTDIYPLTLNGPP